VAILEQAQHARNNPCDVKFFPDGTLAWPEVLRPRWELRGDAVAEPPPIDIGADMLNIERRPAEPARITICRQSPQDAGYREIFVSIDGEQVAMLEYGDTYTAEIKPGPPPVLTRRGADILVQVEKMLDDAAKAAARTSATEPPKPTGSTSSSSVTFPESFAAASPSEATVPPNN